MHQEQWRRYVPPNSKFGSQSLVVTWVQQTWCHYDITNSSNNYITRVPPPFDTNILLGSQSLVVTWADKIWFSLVPGAHRNWHGSRGSSTWVASYTHLHLILIAEVIANLLHFLIQQLLYPVTFVQFGGIFDHTEAAYVYLVEIDCLAHNSHANAVWKLQKNGKFLVTSKVLSALKFPPKRKKPSWSWL